MSENKTQKKHKFLNKSQEFNSGDKVSKKVIKSNMFQTPKQTKFTPKIQSEQKQNMKKLNKKRKSLPANLINDDNSDLSGKKPKIDPFTGTSDLFMEMKSENSVVKTKNTKINNSDIKNQSPINSKVKEEEENQASDATPVGKAMNERAKRRKEKLKTLRAAAKEKFKKMIADAVSGDEVAINSIKEKIAKLEEKQKLSSSGKGKLRILKKALKNNTEKDSSNNKASSIKSSKEMLNKADKTTKKELQSQIKKQQSTKNKGTEKKINGSDKKSGKKNFQVTKEEDDSEDVDEEEEEDENSMTNLIEMESVEEEDDDDESDVEEEEDDDDEEEDDDDDEEGDENENKSENESGENSSDEEDETEIQQKSQSTVTKKNTKTEFLEKRNNEESAAAKGQSRYVLFVGNLPFDATKEEIIAHFTKVGSIKDVRIPLRKDTNKSKGFAYVEFLNQTSYEKALSLHHTSLKGRRINVLYTQGGKKKGEEKKKEIKAKNLKLQAMRQGGKLAGSVKQTQKRSARREKKRNAKKDQ